MEIEFIKTNVKLHNGSKYLVLGNISITWELIRMQTQGPTPGLLV